MEYTPADNAYKYYIYANNYAVAEETNGQVTYNHRDHLDSVRLTTDVNGNVVDSMSYSAYGAAAPSITDNFTGSVLDGWTAKTTNAQFLPDNGSLEIIHSTTDYSGDYLVKQFDQIENVSIQFDATIGSINNDCCSLGIELDGIRLVFYSNELYYYNNGWQLVGTVDFDVSNHYQLIFTQNQIEILINNVIVYSVAGSFGPKSYLAYRDYGLCFGPVVNYIGNLNITPLNPEDGQFTGKKYDPGTGLVYFGGRFYDPEVGRFITQDPGKQGLNWYEYCNDNPLNNIDLDGQTAIYIQIYREMETDQSTMGIFTVSNSGNNDVIGGVTLELSDKNNQNDISRIDAGTYDAERTLKTTGMQQEVVVLLNVPGRTGIMIHIGNFPKDTHGCILFGTTIGGVNFITSSKEKMEEVIAYIDQIRADDAKNGTKTTITVTISDTGDCTITTSPGDDSGNDNSGNNNSGNDNSENNNSGNNNSDSNNSGTDN